MAEYSPGLEGVIAGETALCTINEQGLSYGGYSIQELADGCTFEEVAYLLLHGELPNGAERRNFQQSLAAQRALSPELAELVRKIPASAPPMDALRTAVSFQSHFDPDAADSSREANLRKTVRLLAQTPALIAEWNCARQGRPAPSPASDGSHAAHLLRLLAQGGEAVAADPAAERAMDVSLILYAEHEFNASTFAARTVVSTGSDIHSAITAAIGALKGPLHGGANEKVLEVLGAIGTPERAEPWLAEQFAAKRVVMGFGHRVYKDGDVRARLLGRLCGEMAHGTEGEGLEELAARVEALMLERKGLRPNLDWPAARVYHALGLPVKVFTPIFVVARMSGWTAHCIEQIGDNRIIRPLSAYVGPPPRDYVPLTARS